MNVTDYYATMNEFAGTSWAGPVVVSACVVIVAAVVVGVAGGAWRYLDDKTKIALLYASGAGKTGPPKARSSANHPDFHVLEVRSVAGHGARILYVYNNDIYATWQKRVDSRAHRRHAIKKGTQGMDLEDEVMHFFLTDHRTGNIVDITDEVQKLRGPLDDYPNVTASHLLLETGIHPRDHSHHSVTTHLYDGTVRDLRGDERVYEHACE